MKNKKQIYLNTQTLWEYWKENVYVYSVLDNDANEHFDRWLQWLADATCIFGNDIVTVYQHTQQFEDLLRVLDIPFELREDEDERT